LPRGYKTSRLKITSLIATFAHLEGNPPKFKPRHQPLKLFTQIQIYTPTISSIQRQQRQQQSQDTRSKRKGKEKNPSFPYQKQNPIFIIVQIPPLPLPYTTSSLSKPKGIPQYHFCSNQQLCHSIQQEGLILAYQMRS